MNDGTPTSHRMGRPRKYEPPRVPYEELDRILVFGEVVNVRSGEVQGPTTVYPSYRELATRFGVAPSLIAAYARKHDCLRRREVAHARVAAKANEKLVELRANAIATRKDDQIRVIDSFLHGFEVALADGKVRYDDPSYFDKFCRLRTFLEGGADSRSEVHASFSLEDLQSRHHQMLKAVAESTPEERGEVGRARRALPAHAGSERLEVGLPPTSVFTADSEEVTRHFLDTSQGVHFQRSLSALPQDDADDSDSLDEPAE